MDFPILSSLILLPTVGALFFFYIVFVTLTDGEKVNENDPWGLAR